MNFAQPQYLILLVLLPLAVFGLVWANRQRQATLHRLGDPDLLLRLSEAVNWRGRTIKTALWLMALMLMIVALARPTWGEDVQEIEQQGVQVMVALDVSDSMLAEDVVPNRLTRAKLEISDMMNRLDGDEIGLVLFSGASYIQFPLTNDYDTARTFLDNARSGVISRPGTVIGEAIRTAMSGFDDHLSAQKVIVVFTDGEDSETDPIAAAQEATDAGIIIYTVGFGTDEGAPIPIKDANGNITGYKQNASGETVMSRVDDTMLKQIAEMSNGIYFSANESDALTNLLTNLNALQAGSLGQHQDVRGIERFQIFLLIAVIVLVAIELIPDRKSKSALPRFWEWRFTRKGAVS